ncbi:hypothetical protein [Embleya sp. NBC_00896]|uniref:hypothetical protein n=1 Tax=Embleya sp. NBC_00896 TaxID=2975961 RepID=UPI003865C5BF|nr:hypothetical protein OG928_31735 [Embleya sp. NBC_00896]
MICFAMPYNQGRGGGTRGGYRTAAPWASRGPLGPRRELDRHSGRPTCSARPSYGG